jgi:hypothetical protein
VATIRFVGYVGMLYLAKATWSAGGWLEGENAKTEKSMVLMTYVRNGGVSSFPGTPAAGLAIACALFQGGDHFGSSGVG